VVQNLPIQLIDDRAIWPNRRILRDLRTLIRFISIYCRDHHSAAAAVPFVLKGHDIEAIAGGEVCLCPTCAKLLAHAFTKRTHCPMDPKPACKHCPQHCYNPAYREQIQKIMHYSGRKLLLSGRVDYLVRMMF